MRRLFVTWSFLIWIDSREALGTLLTSDNLQMLDSRFASGLPLLMVHFSALISIPDYRGDGSNAARSEPLSNDSVM